MFRLLQPFEYHEAASVQEAVDATGPLRRPRPRGRGRHRPGHLDEETGTGPRARHRPVAASPGWTAWSSTPATGMRLGPLVTHATIARSPLVRRYWPMLATASNEVGTPAIRTMGTIGGNVCKSGPSQDTPPVLVALEAELQLVGPHGERVVPMDGVLHRPVLHHPRARRADHPDPPAPAAPERRRLLQVGHQGHRHRRDPGRGRGGADPRRRRCLPRRAHRHGLGGPQGHAGPRGRRGATRPTRVDRADRRGRPQGVGRVPAAVAGRLPPPHGARAHARRADRTVAATRRAGTRRAPRHAPRRRPAPAGRRRHEGHRRVHRQRRTRTNWPSSPTGC